MDQENQILAQRLPVLLPELDRRYSDLRTSLVALAEAEFDEATAANLDLRIGDLLSALNALTPCIVEDE